MRKLFALLVVTLAAAQAIATEDPVQTAIRQLEEIRTDPQRYQQSYDAGRERVHFCGYCHGDTGNSKRDYVPNLAAQNSAYLFRQFEKFRSGERTDYVMTQLAKSLTLEERVNIALYYSAQSVESRPPADTALYATGQGLFQKVCFSCHGKQGQGVESMPRLAGQPATYVRQALTKFRKHDLSRASSPMVGIAAMLSDADIAAVAAYVQNM